MRLLLSPQALKDIGEIEQYTDARWGPEQSERYVRELYAACERLIGDPALGRARRDVPPPYLVYAVGSHVIVYRSSADAIEVLNILHPAMNIAERLRAALTRTRH